MARIGCYEVAAIVSNKDTLPSIRARLGTFQCLLSAPFIWRDQTFTVTAAISMTIPSNPYFYDPEELFIIIDAALYAGKRNLRRAMTFADV